MNALKLMRPDWKLNSEHNFPRMCRDGFKLKLSSDRKALTPAERKRMLPADKTEIDKMDILDYHGLVGLVTCPFHRHISVCATAEADSTNICLPKIDLGSKIMCN